MSQAQIGHDLMPRDAYISIYSLARLHGFCEAMNDVSKLCLDRPVNGTGIFYSSLFQAGIDRVVIEDEGSENERKQIPAHRLSVLTSPDYFVCYMSLQTYFNNYLGNGWDKKPEYKTVGNLRYFLNDLLTSFRLRRPLLTTSPIPDIAPLQVTLPLEILSPVKKLFRAIKSYDSVVATPTLQAAKENISIFGEIMASSTYRDVEETNAQLLLKPSVTKSCLAQLEKANHELYWRWKDFLRIKSSLLRVVRNIPDILEAFFGKAPSSVAKPILEAVSERLREEHGLLIYDASPLLTDNMKSLMHQIANTALPDAKELEHRLQRIKNMKEK